MDNAIAAEGRLITRLAVMMTVGMLCVAGTPSPAAAQDDLPPSLVRDLHTAFGEHHARAIHAKGIILTGRFTPAPGAAGLSKAALFQKPTSVIVRFSDFTGIPTIPDNIDNANPRGFAIKFGEVGDAQLDIVAHSFNGFPVATSVEFGTLFQAISASGPDAAKPTALDKFLARHPVAATFLTSQRSPASFATAGYFGVNAFRFTDTRGQSTPVRYRFVPVAGEHYLSAAALKAEASDYLMREVSKRVEKGPIGFDWYAQIAGDGDKIDDPSIAWPETRALMKLGTISVNQIAADQISLDKHLMFLPGNVPDGIESADPMIGVRTAAYPVSFGERQ